MKLFGRMVSCSYVTEVLRLFLELNRAIKFAYLFGSHARGNAGPQSDVDLAVYLDNRFDLFSFRLRLLEELSRQLKGQPCNLVVLNNASLVLRYEVIRDGKLLKEEKKASAIRNECYQRVPRYVSAQSSSCISAQEKLYQGASSW